MTWNDNNSRLLVSWLITISAVSLLAIHLIFPAKNMDATSLFLFAFAVVPWLGKVFKRLELPGGLKFEYQDFVKAVAEAKDSGLLPHTVSPNAKALSTEPDPVYAQVLESDPNLALAGLRIDIEQRLRSLALAAGIDSPSLGLNSLLRDLTRREVLTSRQVRALEDILRSLNGAVHGEQITIADAQSVMKIGRDLVTSLDKFGGSNAEG